MNKKILTLILSMLVVAVFILVTAFQKSVHSKELPFTIVDIENISRYDEDRILYQHNEDTSNLNADNSVATFMIILKSKMYLFRDGYDDPARIFENKMALEKELKVAPDLWINKINGKPDYVRITDRRIELLRNNNEEFVNKNFGIFYSTKRDEFLKRHVQLFKQLMMNRKEAGLYIDRHPLPRKIYDTGPSKFFTSVSGKTLDETLYYAEDSDGDDVTETFTVSIPDGFSWGFQSGPNIILIFKNKQEDIKNIIGKLTHDAFFGTTEEEDYILKTLPKSEDISRMIEEKYRLK